MASDAGTGGGGMRALGDERLTARFDVREKIGEGGFARVFRALDRRTGTPVALKVLKDDYLQDPEVLARFRREVYAVAAIANPHIVALHDFGIEGDLVYLATEFVDGGTLRDAMRTRTFSNEEVLAIVSQIAEALGAAHGRDIVHRDLKPENVLLASGAGGAPRVKVVDFGVAKLAEVERELGLAPVSRAGVSFGTPQYMAPEQIRGEATGPGVDRFALAVIAYELLAGAVPWLGEAPHETFVRVTRERPPPIPRARAPWLTRRRLDRFFARALAKDPARRPPDGDALVRELDRALFGAGRGQPVVRGSRAAWALAAAALALAAAAAAWLVTASR